MCAKLVFHFDDFIFCHWMKYIALILFLYGIQIEFLSSTEEFEDYGARKTAVLLSFLEKNSPLSMLSSQWLMSWHNGTQLKFMVCIS